MKNIYTGKIEYCGLTPQKKFLITNIFLFLFKKHLYLPPNFNVKKHSKSILDHVEIFRKFLTGNVRCKVR
jgi:hypothetical protein